MDAIVEVFERNQSILSFLNLSKVTVRDTIFQHQWNKGVKA